MANNLSAEDISDACKSKSTKYQYSRAIARVKRVIKGSKFRSMAINLQTDSIITPMSIDVIEYCLQVATRKVLPDVINVDDENEVLIGDNNDEYGVDVEVDVEANVNNQNGNYGFSSFSSVNNIRSAILDYLRQNGQVLSDADSTKIKNFMQGYKNILGRCS